MLLALVVTGCAGRADAPGVMAAGPAPVGGAPDAAPAPPAVDERDVDVGQGMTLHVRTVGATASRRTIVLLHGGPGFSHHYMQALERLAGPDVRVVNFDQRGAGASRQPADDRYDLAAYVSDLEGLRTALGADRLDVVGHSWGGLVAMAYAVAQPTRVRSLVLVDSVPPRQGDFILGGLVLGERHRALVKQGIVTKVLPPSDGDDCRPQLLALLPVYFADPAHPAAHDLAGSTCSLHARNETWFALGEFDLRPGVATLAMPVLVVQGEGSPFGRAMHRAVVAAFAPGIVTEVTLPACGHVPWAECAAPFDAALDAFLGAH